MIYDKQFKQDLKTAIPGIYTFGSDNAELLTLKEIQTKALKECESSIEVLEGDIKTAEESKKSILDNYAGLVWKERTTLSKTYDEKWSKGYNNNKTKLANDLLREFEDYYADSTSMDRIDEMHELLSKKEQDKHLMQQEIELQEIDISILGMPIVSPSQSNLNEYYRRLNNIDWVKKGREMNSGQLCPYCMQQLPPNFKERLEEVFNQIYEENISKLNKTIGELSTYYQYIGACLDNLEFDSLETYDYRPLRNARQSIVDTIRTNRSLIEKKLDEPSTIIELESIDSVVENYNTQIGTLNEQISQRNEDIDRIKEVEKEFTKSIWGLLAKNCKEETDEYKVKNEAISKTLAEKQAALDEAKNNKVKILESLKGINTQITDITKTVDDINYFLKSYGFTNFKLIKNESSEGTYCIVRPDGSDATDTLSEGESNLVAFLYFYCLVRGSPDPLDMLAHKIVVIDDPVNSMDNDVMSIIISVTRAIIFNVKSPDNIQNIDQIILFTHNVHFHSESDCEGKYSSYNRIVKSDNRSSIETTNKSTIVSGYQQLWAEYATSDSPVTSFNVMRRILQNFFENMVGLSSYEKCRDKFEGKDSILMRDLTREINGGSHILSEPVDYSIDEESIKIYKRIFKEVFSKMGYMDHYNLMMGQVDDKKI